jgi:hypothetical protein
MRTSIFYSIIILIVFGLTVACNQQSSKDIPADVVHNPISADGEGNLEDLPAFEFKEKYHDFGSVIQGEKVTYGFKFKNIGNSDLLITKVTTSCGCTAPEYPKKPIKPGEEGAIQITFDSRGRVGYQNKSATVVANTQPNQTKLRIKAKVIKPDDM